MVLFNYPPKEIFNTSLESKPNYDHIILWMLNNNEICLWSHFTEDPINIPIGTLSRHLNELKYNGFIEKISRGNYKITTEGKKKFYELSKRASNKRILNYPPITLLKEGRIYSDWILWMLYNNNYCIRDDFLKDPLNINNSSLSKNLNNLIEKDFINKEEGKFKITQSGKSEYARMLERYDLDRQSILNEERKKIEDLNTKIRGFFEKFNIQDKEVQYYFINYLLKLPYENVNQLLKNEEDFYKILLYLSLNHPNNYPNYINATDFSIKFHIKKVILDYYIDEISEGKIYKTKFFKLISPSGGQYYFQANGKLDRMLQIITENQINKFAYINTLFSKSLHALPISIRDSIIEQIFDQLKESLFHKDLKEPLKKFLPDYIKYLSYKIKEQRELKSRFDKIEGIIWQNMTEIFDAQFSPDFKQQYEEKVRDLQNKIELEPDNAELYKAKIKILVYYNQYNEVLNLLDEMLKVFPEDEIDIKMKKASIYKKKKDIDAGLEIIEELLQNYPENTELLNYKAYWLQYLGNKEEALQIIQNLINENPNKGIYYDNFGEILMYFEDYNEAVKKFLKAVVMCGDEWFIYQSYIKLGICYKALGEFNLAIKNLKMGKELIENSSDTGEIKNKWLFISDLFLSELNLS